MSQSLSTVAPTALPDLIDSAVNILANARSAAEVLEARDFAATVYDAAKRAARIGKAKQAHDSLIADAHRAQAKALEIEAGAKLRLADEYDAAQERGEVAKIGDNLPSVPKENSKPTAADIGLTRKDIHEARIIRDAEEEDPGVIKRTLDDAIDAGEEPTRAKVRRAALKARKKKAKKRTRKTTVHYEPESEHDRDLALLRNVWSTSCASARRAFLLEINQTP